MRDYVKFYGNFCDLYKNGHSVTEIAKEYNCSIGTIYHALNLCGIEAIRNHSKISQFTKDEIIELYNNKISRFEISKTGIASYQTVCNVIQSANIEKISDAVRFNNNLNENYFETIDTPNKAYWLGWLITDGSITKGYTIGLTRQERDICVLENLQTDLGLNNKIKMSGTKYKRFSFCCKKMVNDLFNYGIIPNKTFTVRLPKLSKELIPYLLRGLFGRRRLYKQGNS